ncbi:MAG: Hsp20/alpha crystallin family protein [Caldilineaceae bacterium]|nr:Hsp20/alpha crystallin family protein [Caldilineaceae bacterium]
MSRIVRWDPFRDMVAMRSQMDHIMDEWLRASNAENGENSQAMRLAIDVSETENNFIVKASIPGISPDDLDISFADNTLTIQGERKDEHVEENERFHLRERRFGHFMRTIALPLAVNADKIEAQHENGVLTLTLPKAEETKPRKISIRNSQPVVEG